METHRAGAQLRICRRCAKAPLPHARVNVMARGNSLCDLRMLMRCRTKPKDRQPSAAFPLARLRDGDIPLRTEIGRGASPDCPSHAGPADHGSHPSAAPQAPLASRPPFLTNRTHPHRRRRGDAPPKATLPRAGAADARARARARAGRRGWGGEFTARVSREAHAGEFLCGALEPGPAALAR